MLPDGPLITYQVEAWSRVLPELEACWKDHWREIAHDQDRMPLAVDYAAYRALEVQGWLHVLTVRVDEELAGYCISVICGHLHYATTLCAVVDVYYVKPGYRAGFLGVRLFRELERCLKARGAQKVFLSTKLAHDKGALFRRLRWRPVETVYSKWLGED